MDDYVFSWAQDASGRMVHVDSVPVCPGEYGAAVYVHIAKSRYMQRMVRYMLITSPTTVKRARPHLKYVMPSFCTKWQSI